MRGGCIVEFESSSVHWSVYVQCCRISVYTVYTMLSNSVYIVYIMLLDFSVHCVYNAVRFQCTLCIYCRRISVYITLCTQCCRISVYIVYIMPSDFSIHCAYNVVEFQCTLCIQCCRMSVYIVHTMLLNFSVHCR